MTAPIAGSYVSDAEPAVQGLTSDLLDPVSVQLYAGPTATGTPLQTLAAGPAGPAGEWAALPEAPLPDGQYTVVAEQSEMGEGGEEGEGGVSEALGASEAVTFTVKTAPPAVTIEAPARYTNDPMPTLRGDAGTAPGDLASVLVRLYAGEATTGTPVAEEAVTPAGGSWSYTAPSLADGTYTAQVSQGDEAGNVGLSAAESFTVDLIAPAVSITSPTWGALLSVARPTISGDAASGSVDLPTIRLRISTDEKLLETIDLTESKGVWSTGSDGPALANGLYTLIAEQEDRAGNVGVSLPVSFAVDTFSPLVTIAGQGLVDREGGTFTGPEPAFFGQGASEGEDAHDVTLNLYEGDSTARSARLRSLPAPLTGDSWSSGVGAALPDGTYTVQAEQEGPAGRQPGVSAALTFTVDADAPAVTLLAPADGGMITGSAIEASGQAGTAAGDDPEVTVRVFAGSSVGTSPVETGSGGVSAGGWSARLGALAAGVYTAQAEQSDDVGNLGVSAPSTFTVAQPLTLMQPFPIVRIAGSEGAKTVTIKLLTVQAPAGADVTVTCRGKGCPTKRLSTVEPSRQGHAAGAVLLSIRRFERRLPVGVVLEIRVSKAGEIGKYTKFVTRRGKLPVRTDSCLAPDSDPMECPTG